MDIYYILILCVILIIIYKNKINNYSLFTEKSDKNALDNNVKSSQIYRQKSDKNALCFIIRQYNELLFEFAETCTFNYDVYIVIDDNSTIIPSKNNVNIVQISNQECLDNYFIRSTYRFNQDVTGWDKAFYYFTHYVDYNYVWFLEDDVYFGNSIVLKKIDNKYENIDMLCEGITHHKTNNYIKEFKKALKIEIYQSMICAVRLSKNVLDLLKIISQKYKRLYFHEILLLSLVKQYKLSCLRIPELSTIRYRHDWKYNTVKSKPSNLFHPIKDLNIQKKLRKHFSHLLL
jgi:hypothetical protein